MVHTSTIFFTKAGNIIPTVTGTISFLSSSTIIYIILRSKSGVKITYHRIILGLSIADCLTSFVTLLTTIPMPKDVIYPFALASYGNVATCEAQGLVYIIGNAICFSMNGILNIYYLCSLRFNMKEHTFRNYLEIPLYILMLALSIGVSCGAFLNQEIINPSPTDPYCVPNSYPANCPEEDNPDCRGGGGRGAFTPGYLATLSIATFTLLVTMTLIIHAFYRNERKLRKAVKDKQIQEDDEAFQALLHAQEMFGIITRQAMMYIAAFVITWIFGVLEFLWQTEVIAVSDRGVEILIILRIIFQPLQGLFNLIIFVYHKAHVNLRSDEDMTLGEAIIEIFLNTGNIEDSVQIHNLDVVFDYTENLHVPQLGEDHRTEVENGLEEVDLTADDGIIFNSRNASQGGSSCFVRSGVLPPIDEDRTPTRLFYNSGQSATPSSTRSLEMVKKNDVSVSGLSIAPELPMQENNDGVSFAAESRSPSNGRNEQNDRKEAFNDDDVSYSESRSMLSVLSGFSSVLSRKNWD